MERSEKQPDAHCAVIWYDRGDIRAHVSSDITDSECDEILDRIHGYLDEDISTDFILAVNAEAEKIRESKQTSLLLQ